MVTIIADTTCSLPQEMLKTRGIPFVPQIVIFDEQAYHDNGELDTAAFLQKLRAATALPKTAAPEPHQYFPHFAAAEKSGETLIVVAPSAKVSGTVRAAETARQDYPKADVRIVDTQTIACNLGSLVLMADDLAKQDKSPEEIIATLNDYIPRGRLYFVLDTLEYLRRGGRIGGAKPAGRIAAGKAHFTDPRRTGGTL
jgi:DegV family protein with EDD domain